ncbi:MAG: UDP-N-acetylglucosamine 2-epimerase (non-hydrolyzing) [Sandaracinaceae bacterium]|nr:UDP-N-acetylglucosamine 2-epimerase (non-hydrolyzing) [Sandaracinaceae bacterium]
MSFGLVVGTRPNFVKAAPILRALQTASIPCKLIHTGQHFDKALSDSFFQRLGLPTPDVHLGVSANGRGEQFGEIVRSLSAVLPSLELTKLIVVGDVTSTAAAAIAADCCDIAVVHVEAGLRSFDQTMPEERNRRIVDAIAKELFASEPAGVTNLLREGHDQNQVFLVGNVMIDTLLRFRDEALAATPWKNHGVEKSNYAVATLHRPANVDTEAALRESVAILGEVARDMPVLFAVHPRTTARLQRFGITLPAAVSQLPPQDYFDFLGLMGGAAVVLTDSGGAQEETTALGVPCLTLRENTERPITVEQGTSRLCGRRIGEIRNYLDQIKANKYQIGSGVPLWDGHAAERIVAVLAK